MAEKGGTGENVFKLTVKVELLGNGSNENTIEQLQKSFQKELTHLRQHFKDHAHLHDQFVHHVIKEKRNLGFEFWVKNKEDLEKLKRSIEEDTFAKTLSEYSYKKGLHRVLGFLSSEGLCFRCTIKEKQYLQGLLRFTDEASDSDNEGTEEKDPNQSLPLTSRDASVPMGQHHGSKAHTAPVLHGSDAFRGSGVGMHQTSSSSTPLVQQHSDGHTTLRQEQHLT